jgi:hypothetical protein
LCQRIAERVSRGDHTFTELGGVVLVPVAVRERREAAVPNSALR